MPVIYPQRFVFGNLTGGPITLTPPTGEGYIVRRFGVNDGVATENAYILIDGQIMMSFPVAAGDRQLFTIPNLLASLYDLMDALRAKYPDIPLFRIPEGKEFTLGSLNNTGAYFIEYITVAGGDIPKMTDPGAPDAKTKLYVSSGHLSESVAAGATNQFHVWSSLNQIGLSKFPWEETVEPGVTYDLVGFVIDKVSGCGVNIDLLGVRTYHDEEPFLCKHDEWLDPAYFAYPEQAAEREVRLFPEAKRFIAGQKNTWEIQVENTGGAPENAVIDITAFYIQRK